jgi:signal transduction histidine kinase
VSNIYHRGGLVAAIVHDEVLDANVRLVEAGGAIAGVVLDNQRLAVETDAARGRERHSRARIAASADRERRRIERDLHDGAQQRLVALGIELELTEDVVKKDPDRAVKRLQDLRGQVADALEEVRSLAHGVYPPLLADLGLVEALRAIAIRSPVTVDVRAHDVRRYPAEVESAVYFCCLEALQNAGKHAGDGARATIRVLSADGVLRFRVEDTGVGFDAHRPGAGMGIANMTERMAAIGGHVRVVSQPRLGTAVSGWVALEEV